MTTVYLSLFAGAGQQFFDNNGVPLAGGLLYTYSAGTTTQQATYTSSSGSISNSNPIVLDSSGRVPNEIWLLSGSTYKFVLQTSASVQLGSWDNIPGANDISAFKTTLASSTGSSLIGYDLGGSSAVATTVQAKLQQTVSVKDFGAVGNGTADDTTAFNSAISYCLSNGTSLYVPAGTYNISSTLNAVKPIKIYGETGLHTYGYSIINYTGTGNCFALGDQTTQSFANHWMTFQLENLVITGSSSATNGVLVYNISIAFEKLWIKNFSSGYGIYSAQAYASVIRDCQFQGNEYGVLVTSLGGQLKIDNCAFLSNTFGLIFTGLTSPFSGGIYSVEVSNNDFEGCTYGVFFGHTNDETISDEVSSVQFNTVHFESNTNDFYSGSGCYVYGLTIINSNFTDGTTTFKRVIGGNIITPTFFSTSVLTAQAGYNSSIIVINPVFYTGWSGTMTGVACLGMGSYVIGKAPVGSLLIESNDTINSANAYLLRGSQNLFAPLVQSFSSALTTTSGAVSVSSTDSSLTEILVNEVVSSVTITITNTATTYGAKQTFILSTNNSSSLNKSITFTGVGTNYYYSSITTPNATNAITSITFAYSYTASGWVEIGRSTNITY